MVLLLYGIALHRRGLVDMGLHGLGIMMAHECSPRRNAHEACRRGHTAVMLTVKSLLLTDF